MRLSEMKQLLSERQILLTKSLGQNFLHDGNQLRRILAAAELDGSDKVLEIGPGLGPLTTLLVEQAAEVLAIEKDARLVDLLKQDRRKKGSAGQLQIVHTDALDFLKNETRDWSEWKLVANLPFAIASPILVEMALAVDLVFAGDLSQLCGAAVWNEVRAAVGERIRAVYMIRDGNYQQYALAAMLATGADDHGYALDARTGRAIWRYERNLPRKIPACCGRVNRGFAALGDLLFMATLDAHVVALDAKTGNIVWDVEAADYKLGHTFTVAPLVVKDKVIVGISGGEYGIRGFIDAYDAATGKRAWRFYTIPSPHEPGNETWAGDSWSRGGAPAWVTPGAADPIHWSAVAASVERTNNIHIQRKG